MGWTHGDLISQPTRFVEKLRIYLDAVTYKEEREHRRLEEEIGRLRRRR